MKKQIIIIGIVITACVCGLVGYSVYQNHLQVLAKETAENKAALKKAYQALFSDKKQTTIQLEVKTKDVNKVKKLVAKLEDKEKRTYTKRLIHIDAFIKTRDEIRQYIPGGVLKSTITNEEIVILQAKLKKLETGFQTVLSPMFETITTQRQTMKDVEALCLSFYEGDSVKNEINTEDLNRFKDLLTNLPQRDIAQQYQDKLNAIQKKLDELEAQERARVEAERQAAIARAIAESERLRKENEAIQAANVIIPNVPLIDQSINVHNGCEVASLLMGLQHFGINQGMTLIDIANAVPKTNDPHTGFVMDIFTLYPRNIAHWIAPDALAKFGQTYHAGVQDISGSSVDQLKAEIDAGNPVIFYATYGFVAPRGWCWNNQTPVNMHVMLMTGYNKITGNIIVNEPWGGKQIVVPIDKFTYTYNLCKYAVAIRP